MVDNSKVINFLQDFGCATLEQLKILFGIENNNFKKVLIGNMVSRKGNIIAHNTKRINEKMLIALDILCKYKSRLYKYYLGYHPIQITFISREHLVYHIIVADEDNKKGIVKIINGYPNSLPKADKLILAFPDEEQLEYIECDIPFLYCTYPDLEIINS